MTVDPNTLVRSKLYFYSLIVLISLYYFQLSTSLDFFTTTIIVLGESVNGIINFCYSHAESKRQLPDSSRSRSGGNSLNTALSCRSSN